LERDCGNRQNILTGGAGMAGNLRADIRSYEEENKIKVKGPVWPHMRCINCPMSFMGCASAKKSITAEKQ